ncbi:MAG: hypothetical protein CMP59_08235 [Flavobacteriales bacterium]|nr:hypothetical protein [Flavobacteriales bacterium]
MQGLLQWDAKTSGFEQSEKTNRSFGILFNRHHAMQSFQIRNLKSEIRNFHPAPSSQFIILEAS